MEVNAISFVTRIKEMLNVIFISEEETEARS